MGAPGSGAPERTTDETRRERIAASRPATPSSPDGITPVDAAQAQLEAIERQEHVSNTLAMRRVLVISFLFWPAFGLLDWVVARYIEPGDLRVYWGLRAAELVIIALCSVRVFRAPIPSPRTLMVLDLTIFTSAAVAISLMCLEYRGIASPYATGVICVVAVRGAALASPWRQSLFTIGVPAVSFPVTMLVTGLFSPQVAAQLGDPRALAVFAQNLGFLGCVLVVIVWGAHVRWSLRRKVYETRSIGLYRLERRIGAGGMGEVWAAYHRILQRGVALKILRLEDGADQARVARFEREVAATSGLSHPNTIRVFDYGVTDDGIWYYAMELLEGESLAALVEREGPLPPARAIYFVLQATRALAEAHARGIVHRDIKPANLFAARMGGEPDFLKVLDFGIAKVVGPDRSPTLTHTGWLLGTPHYISPEVARGAEADARSDLYALGAVLYFLLTGRPPFQREDAAALLQAHIAHPPVPPSIAGGRAVPPELDAIVLRCLEKDPALRYQSAHELAHALAGCADAAAAIDPEPAQARARPDPSEPTWDATRGRGAG